jgi:hypothetical protein
VLGEGHQTRLGISCPKGQNVMLKIFDRFESLGWRHFPPFHAVIYNRRAVLLKIPVPDFATEVKRRLQEFL